MNNPPKYKVKWIANNGKQKYTFAFHTPEYALELAVIVVRNGNTLISVDQ